MGTLFAPRRKFMIPLIGPLLLLASFHVQARMLQTSSTPSSATNSIDNYADGHSDATEVIQSMIDAAAGNGGVVNLSKGDYLIDPGKSIQLRSGTKLVMDRGTRLIASPTKSGVYAIIKVYGVHDVNIDGGQVIGERNRHRGKEGEWGMGIDVKGSSSVRISNVTISDCWGDGVYIGAWKGTPSTNITLDSVSSLRNRRQGLSITSADGVLVVNSRFNGTSGTAPAAGIDLEPNKGENVSNVTILNCEARDNQGSGIMTWNSASKVKITGCSIQNNASSGVYLGGDVDSVEVSGNVVLGNRKKDIFLGDKVKNQKLERNTFTPGP